MEIQTLPTARDRWENSSERASLQHSTHATAAVLSAGPEQQDAGGNRGRPPPGVPTSLHLLLLGTPAGGGRGGAQGSPGPAIRAQVPSQGLVSEDEDCRANPPEYKTTSQVSGQEATGRALARKLHGDRLCPRRPVHPQHLGAEAYTWGIYLKNLYVPQLLRTHLIGVHVAGGPDGYDVGVVGEYGEQHWAVVLS